MFEPQAPRFACICSRQRVASMLRGLGADEVRGNVEVGCDFCGVLQHFDPVDVDGLFTPVQDQPPASVGLQ